MNDFKEYGWGMQRSKPRKLKKRWLALVALVGALSTKPLGEAIQSVCPVHTDKECNMVGRVIEEIGGTLLDW